MSNNNWSVDCCCRGRKAQSCSGVRLLAIAGRLYDDDDDDSYDRPASRRSTLTRLNNLPPVVRRSGDRGGGGHSFYDVHK